MSEQVDNAGNNGKDWHTNQKDRAKKIMWVLYFFLVIFAYLLIDSARPEFGLFKYALADDLLWVQWLFAGFGGTLLYLIWESQRQYRVIDKVDPLAAEKKGDEAIKKSEQVNFILYTPWYIAVAVRGPIIVMAVMFAVTNVTLAATLLPEQSAPATEKVAPAPDEETDVEESIGQDSPAIEFGVDLSKSSQNVLVLSAFILGFFNRLPLAILEGVAKSLFKSAWVKVYGEAEDEPDKAV